MSAIGTRTAAADPIEAKEAWRPERRASLLRLTVTAANISLARNFHYLIEVKTPSGISRAGSE
jgi:hypothetical protein